MTRGHTSRKSYMHPPPFQVPLDRWKALGGRVQDLRARKFYARAAACLGVVYRPFNVTKMTRGHTSRKSAKSARGVPISLAQAKKSPGGCQGFSAAGYSS